jgi:hypothetical protein
MFVGVAEDLKRETELTNSNGAKRREVACRGDIARATGRGHVLLEAGDRQSIVARTDRRRRECKCAKGKEGHEETMTEHGGGVG